MSLLTLVLASSLLARPAASASPRVAPPAGVEAASRITAERIRAHVKFLASDLLEGRGPGSRGDRLAEEYIAGQLEALGIPGGAPRGGYFQRVPLVRVASAVPESVAFTAGDRSLELKYREDFVASSGTQKPVAKVEAAEVVFAGYGIVAPEYRWSDFKDVNVRGKILLVMNNDPENDPNLFAGKKRLRYGRWDYKYEQAARVGAAGVIIIHTSASASYPWQVVRTSWSGPRFELADDGSPRVAIEGWVTEDAARRLAELGGKNLDELRASAESRDFRPVPLGVRLSMAITNTIEPTASANVIGVIPGSDPKLSREAVLYTAHHDHLGIKSGAAAGEDAICNGALDNASGAATILSIAAAFAELHPAPRRTVYFALVAAEEQGLLGSEYLAGHLPLPSGRIAADINIDGIGIWGKTRDIAVIGLGESSLDADIAAAAKAQGRRVQGDEFPEKGSFYRSDQYSLAKAGIPSVHLVNGTDVIGKPAGWGREQIELYEKTDYHQPSDEYRESWNLDGAVEDARLAFSLGVALADAPGLPHWNKGNEFEAIRLKAVAATATP